MHQFRKGSGGEDVNLDDNLDAELSTGKDEKKEKVATRGHFKLAVGMLGIFCVVVLVGGGAMYGYTEPTPKLTAAADTCADDPPYRYFTPVEWSQVACTMHNKTNAAKVQVVVSALSSFLPCGVCTSADGCGNVSCVPSSVADAADSNAILAIMTAANCASIARLSTKDAFNATMYASTLDKWTHALEPGNVAATVLKMYGYNTSEQCKKYKPCVGMFC